MDWIGKNYPDCADRIQQIDALLAIKKDESLKESESLRREFFPDVHNRLSPHGTPSNTSLDFASSAERNLPRIPLYGSGLKPINSIPRSTSGSSIKLGIAERSPSNSFYSYPPVPERIVPSTINSLQTDAIITDNFITPKAVINSHAVTSMSALSQFSGDPNSSGAVKSANLLC